MKAQPTVQRERIVSLDIIRGIALFGILLINVPGYLLLTQDSPAPDMSGTNSLIQLLVDLLVEKKFFCMFSFLFGVGFHLFLSRSEARDDRYYLRMSRRLLAMLLFGVLDLLFLFWGDILTFYALLGFLLLPFYKRSPQVIAGFAGVLGFLHLSTNALCMVFQDAAGSLATIRGIFGTNVSLIFIMFLLGLFTGKTGLINQVGGGRVWKAAQATSFFLFAALTALLLWIHALPETKVTADAFASLQGLVAVPGALFYLTSLFRLLENQRIARALRPIGQMGRMAFTNYIGQYVIGRTIIAIAGIQVVSPLSALYISLAIFAAELLVSNLWLRAFAYGPLEYIWRVATYGKWQTARKAEQHTG